MIKLMEYRFSILWRLLLVVIFLSYSISIIMVLSILDVSLWIVPLFLLPIYFFLGIVNRFFVFRKRGTLSFDEDHLRIDGFSESKLIRWSELKSLKIYVPLGLPMIVQVLGDIGFKLRYLNFWHANNGALYFERIILDDSISFLLKVERYSDFKLIEKLVNISKSKVASFELRYLPKIGQFIDPND